MKKLFIMLIAVLGLALAAQSCTDDTVQEDIETYSPDKETCPPGGCPN